MQSRPWPKELDSFSTRIGNNILLVQGPGGNTSYKDEKTMWVKASGTKLADADVKRIFIGIDIASGESLPDEDKLRPSIEKDFHLLIPFAFVIHTHSLRAISFAIENDFGSKASQFPEIAFVPYARPGEELCKLLNSSLDFETHKAAILQNHGFLTWGDSMEVAYNTLIDFEREYLNIAIDDMNLAPKSLKVNHPRAITPDYAVFLSENSEADILQFDGHNHWKKNMYQVAQKAASVIDPQIGINYLSEEEVYSLQNWDSEKFRKTANK